MYTVISILYNGKYNGVYHPEGDIIKIDIPLI